MALRERSFYVEERKAPNKMENFNNSNHDSNTENTKDLNFNILQNEFLHFCLSNLLLVILVLSVFYFIAIILMSFSQFFILGDGLRFAIKTIFYFLINIGTIISIRLNLPDIFIIKFLLSIIFYITILLLSYQFEEITKINFTKYLIIIIFVVIVILSLIYITRIPFPGLEGVL